MWSIILCRNSILIKYYIFKPTKYHSNHQLFFLVNFSKNISPNQNVCMHIYFFIYQCIYQGYVKKTINQIKQKIKSMKIKKSNHLKWFSNQTYNSYNINFCVYLSPLLMCNREKNTQNNIVEIIVQIMFLLFEFGYNVPFLY